MFDKASVDKKGRKTMSGSFVLVSIFEVAVAAFIIFGLINEEKFAECEHKFFSSLFSCVKKAVLGHSAQRQ